MIRVGDKVPDLFMSANWFSEKTMCGLFTAGLENGVYGFDTAREYKVEKQVGRAIRRALTETGKKRKDIFVQTRICNEEIIRGNIRDEVYRSMDKMGLDYIDCFMFHWPTPDYYLKAWRELEKVFLEDKRIRSIGMCNLRLRHLHEMEQCVDIMPQVLQIEITPLWQVHDLCNYSAAHGIVLQAFSPLCKMIPPIKKSSVLGNLAEKYGVSIPQIILRWNYQRGIRPISLTSKVERVRTNFDIYSFELTEADMNLIKSMDCGYKYHLESATCWGF